MHPFLVSLLFAGDRFESKGLLEAALTQNEVVVLDRYVPSNIAHQASKRAGAERQALVEQILKIEHDLFGLPRADLVLLLDLPVERAQELIARKSPREYTPHSADLQEADGRYLETVRAVYQSLAASEPGWQVIDCCPAGRLLPVETVHEAVWNQIRPRLADFTRGAPP